MTGRAQQGLTWLADAGAWSHCNNFGFHLHWHVALFQLELGRAGAALRLYDDAVRAEPTDDYRDIANAASLLQRIELEGLDVGERWDELAAIAERRVQDRQLAFADLHYLMALLGAGRFGSAEALVKGMMGAKGGHNAEVSAEIGAPLAAGLLAFRAGRMTEAVGLLAPLRRQMQALGGSHAQRDVFEQLYLEALVRSEGADGRERLVERRSNRGGRNRFAERRLTMRLAETDRGRLAAAVLAITPALQAH